MANPKNISFDNSTAPQLSFAVSTKTRAQFEELTHTSGQIVFLINDQTIYFEGQYFGLSATDAATLADVASRLTSLESDIGLTTEAYTTLKNSQQTLAQGLLSLKTAIDNKIGNTSYTGDSLTAAIAALQTAVSNLAASSGVSSVNTKTGDVTLYAGDISISSNDATTISAALDGKVLISTSDTTLKEHSQISGSSLTSTSAIATAIENAHSAGAAASTLAGQKIAKSAGTTAVKASGASDSVTGIKPSDLQNGENIAQAIENTAVGLIGTSEKWGSGESKTLGQLRTLIDTLSGTVTGMDSATSARITNIINEIRQISDSETDDFANTILDKLLTLMGYSSTTDNTGTAVSGGGGYYNINTGVNNGSTYANTIQGVIDALESYIDQKASDAATAATGGAVTSVKATGATVTGTDAGSGAKRGNVELTIDSSTVGLKTALSQSNGNGASTAAGQSIQQALQDINNAAAAAQTSASTALGLLKWEVI